MLTHQENVAYALAQATTLLAQQGFDFGYGFHVSNKSRYLPATLSMVLKRDTTDHVLFHDLAQNGFGQMSFETGDLLFQQTVPSRNLATIMFAPENTLDAHISYLLGKMQKPQTGVFHISEEHPIILRSFIISDNTEV